MARKAKKSGRKRGGASITCPVCSKDSHVVVTRRLLDGVAVRRVRQCLGRRSHKFETREVLAEKTSA
jgi:transcriptional regulator NrdR family protein